MSTTYYRITCLSPVHIGTGQQLGKFDGAYHNGRWYVVDLDKVFARGVDGNELAQAMSASGFSWAEWLQGRRMRAEEVALYSLPCPQDPREVYIREGMKDVYQQPYIPGSTLKGAIRTAVIWYLMRKDLQLREFTQKYLAIVLRSQKIVQEFARISRGSVTGEEEINNLLLSIQRSFKLSSLSEAESFYDVARQAIQLQRAGRGYERRRIGLRDIQKMGEDGRSLFLPVERKVMGKDPNHDLMRALQVRDSEPVGLEQMEVGLVWTYTIRGGKLVPKREQEGEYKAFAEWLKQGTELRTSIRVDKKLFESQAQEQLRFGGVKQHAIDNLSTVCNEYARTLIQRQIDFASRYQLSVLRDFYRTLQQQLQQLGSGAFLLNISWGGGWEAKTVGDVVQELLQNEEFDDFDTLRERYNLGANPRTRQIAKNLPFPHTRLVAYKDNAPAYPLGWILLTVQNGG